MDLNYDEISRENPDNLRSNWEWINKDCLHTFQDYLNILLK